MNGWGNKRNQRLHRQDLRRIDSKSRKRIRSQRHVRIVGWIFGCMLLLGLLGWGCWMGLRQTVRQMFSENPTYRITDIAVENSGEFLKPEAVQRFLQVRRGQNLLALDLGELRRQLELQPIVEKAEISRELPGRLVVRITERVPVANISSGSAGTRYQIDRYGVIISYQGGSEEFKKRLAALPEIIGASITDLRIGRATTSMDIFYALSLIFKMDRMNPGMFWDIKTIDVSHRGSEMLVVTTTEKSMIKIGITDMDQQLRRFAKVLEDANQRSLRIATVDLTIGRDVPVTFASAAP